MAEQLCPVRVCQIAGDAYERDGLYIAVNPVLTAASASAVAAR